MSPIFPDGEGIFETIMTIDGAPFALTRHLLRARRSADRIGMEIPSELQIRAKVDALLAVTPVATEIGRLRISFFGSGEVDLTHDGFQRWSAAARLTLLNHPIDEDGPRAGIKSLPYRENISLLEQVRACGFDEGVRLNSKGEVCEGIVSNLLLRINGIWVTPSLSSGALPGVIRELLLEWFDIRERAVTVAELVNVDAIFLLSSLKMMQPVSFLIDRELVIDAEFVKAVAIRMKLGIDP